MITSAQSKAGLMILFINLFGLIQSSGSHQSNGRGAHTDSDWGQEVVAQTAEKNVLDAKAREDLIKLLGAVRQKTEEYNTLFRDLAAEEKRTSIPFKKSGEEDKRGEVICEFVVYQSSSG